MPAIRPSDLLRVLPSIHFLHGEMWGSHLYWGLEGGECLGKVISARDSGLGCEEAREQSVVSGKPALWLDTRNRQRTKALPLKAATNALER